MKCNATTENTVAYSKPKAYDPIAIGFGIEVDLFSSCFFWNYLDFKIEESSKH